ncbi:MAG: hypothetical protein K2X82_08235 [Gemmataceae bacterium]|nr:hypothetical protein [Gemmataceae bacterium]
MSVSAYAKQTPGTALSWKSSGGDYAITLTSLANGAARQGAKGDLSAAAGGFWARRWAVELQSAVAVAATNGNVLELYWAGSPSATAGTDNPGGASGTDASFATPAEYKLQLTYIGLLNLSNAAGTGVQTQMLEFFPSLRYGMPVLVNSSGQALSGTAGNHEIRLIPVEEPYTTTVSG